METVRNLSETVGLAPACQALGLARSSWYRHQNMSRTLDRSPGQALIREPRRRSPRPRSSARALRAEERREVLDVLHCARFLDQPPAEIYATLLDEGRYLCSPRTMYRILEKEGELRERRDQLRRPQYQRPELLATVPNELWSWDITKLRGPGKWVYFYLYVILDLFSRFVVGWLLAGRESGRLAKRLIEQTCQKEGIEPGKLTVHMDNGSPMRAKCFTQLLADLEVKPSYSRPHTSDDNPFSESQFKTLKYQPEFPDRFGSMADALGFCRRFFPWYNEKHHHGGIGYLTPAQVYRGEAQKILGAREEVLRRAFESHPERFVRGLPKPQKLPAAVWINPPDEFSEDRLSTLAQDQQAQSSSTLGTLVLARCGERG